MVCNVYIIEWEFCRIIPLSADRGISVGTLYTGALHLLTPRSTVFLKKRIGFQLVKKFPAFYGIQRFIAVFTSDRSLSLS